MLTFDPICAIATPPGAAGLAIIRLSGDSCFAIADTCFRGKSSIDAARSHTILYGTFWRDERAIDQVTAFVYRAPHSYTGEDVVEFGCHGGIIVAHEIVQALLEAGARHAEPGEFTKRAFLNRKLDLTQAEAVGDLIHAVSQQGSHTAARQLMGGFTRRLAEVREKLLELCGLLELELDFSQEDLELIDKSVLAKRIEEAREYCLELASAHRSSEILRSGFSVGIVGYPNAGKSSLLNAILGRKRAIVSDIAGTTRDYLEEAVQIGTSAVRMIDTAGFRASNDVIEVAGIQLAESLLESCHLILVLNDISEGETHSNPLLESLRMKFPDAECTLVQTKIDKLPQTPNANNGGLSSNYLSISVVSEKGMLELKQYIAHKAESASQSVSDALINARQAALLAQAASSLVKAKEAVVAGASNEFAAIDLRDALKRIGEITGEVWNEEILNSVFAKFCIGK
jgi:tRNA modification GTPase